MTKCTVCAHKKRQEAETLLAAGKSTREVETATGIGYKALQRHANKCAPAAIAHRVVDPAVVEKRDQLAAANLVGELEKLQAVTLAVIEEAQRGRPLLVKRKPVLGQDGKPILMRDGELTLKGVAQARRNLETMARLTGQLDPKEKESGPQQITWQQFIQFYEAAPKG